MCCLVIRFVQLFVQFPYYVEEQVSSKETAIRPYRILQALIDKYVYNKYMNNRYCLTLSGTCLPCRPLQAGDAGGARPGAAPARDSLPRALPAARQPKGAQASPPAPLGRLEAHAPARPRRRHHSLDRCVHCCTCAQRPVCLGSSSFASIESIFTFVRHRCSTRRKRCSRCSR